MNNQACATSMRSAARARRSCLRRPMRPPAIIRTGTPARSIKGPYGSVLALRQYTTGSTREPSNPSQSSRNCPSAPPIESCPISNPTRMATCRAGFAGRNPRSRRLGRMRAFRPAQPALRTGALALQDRPTARLGAGHAVRGGPALAVRQPIEQAAPQAVRAVGLLAGQVVLLTRIASEVIQHIGLVR